MRKEVQFKAVSAFIFFAGVLFGCNDATARSQYIQVQDGKYPSYAGQNGMASPPADAAGRPFGEINGIHSVGELNGVPYFIRFTTSGPVESPPSIIVQPSYGKNSDDALHHAEMPQSPYYARNPIVIYFTKSPNAPCPSGKPAEVSPVNAPLGYRSADESEPSEETEKPVPRLLFSHLFPAVPKEKRYHYSRQLRDPGHGPQKKRFPRIAKMYKIWHALHHSPREKPRVHHDPISKPPIKNKPLHAPPDSDFEQPYGSPGVTAPPEDNKQLLTPNQPYTGPYPGPYTAPPASPYPADVPPEPTISQFPAAPFPDDPQISFIHFPALPLFADEQPPPFYSLYQPLPYSAEEQHPPAHSPYPPSPSYPEEEPSPYYKNAPPPYYPEEEPSPQHQYPPSSYYPDDQLPHSYRKNPSSPDSSEEQPSQSFRQNPSSPDSSEEGEPSHAFRQFPPLPYYADQTVVRSLPQFPPSPFFPDFSDPGFPTFPPFPPFPPFPFFPDDLGFPPFPTFPFFSDMQEPSSFPRPQSGPYIAGSFTSSQFPTSFLYTATSRPSTNNRKSKARIIAQTSTPAGEIVFTKTLSPDSEDYSEPDKLKLPCLSGKLSRKLSDKTKSSRRGCGSPDNHVILLRDEEDDSLIEDSAKNSAAHTLLTIVEKLAKLIYEQFMTSSDDDDDDDDDD